MIKETPNRFYCIVFVRSESLLPILGSQIDPQSSQAWSSRIDVWLKHVIPVEGKEMRPRYNENRKNTFFNRFNRGSETLTKTAAQSVKIEPSHKLTNQNDKQRGT